MLTRRQVLQGTAVAIGGVAGFGGYALAEPWQLAVTRYRVEPRNWPTGLHLRVAVIADLHVCEPWMGVDRLHRIVEATNALAPDVVLLLGDYRAGHRMLRMARKVPDRVWAKALAGFKAPHGIHAVLGNHDWWDQPELQITRKGPTSARVALEDAGVPVYENDVVRLVKNGQPLWIAGLGDQWAFWRPAGMVVAPKRPIKHEGLHDLSGTLGKITDRAPVILMAHEPDIFPEVPDRVALTVCGHTHGGQVRMFGYAPVVPSAYGLRYVYGHIVEQQRNLVVSGGLGCSAVPMRLGVPPEIVVVELGNWSPVVQS